MATKKRDNGGFGSRTSMRNAAQAYYGKASNITHITVQKTQNWLASQGLNQGQPVNLGGQRFIDKGGTYDPYSKTFSGGTLTTKGQRSDIAGGAGYNAPKSQQKYVKGFGPNPHADKRAGQKDHKGRPGRGHASTVAAAAGQASTVVPDAVAALPYAEGDTNTTGMIRAQGKAYAAGRASAAASKLGQEYAPSANATVTAPTTTPTETRSRRRRRTGGRTAPNKGHKGHRRGR